MKCKREEMFAALRAGTIENYLREKENEQIVEQKLCLIKLPTGKIVANDPLMIYEYEPYLITVAPGEYPVYLYIHHIKTDKRVAFAEIRFTDSLPVRFELARTEADKDVVCSPNEYVGYGVDSGTGGFMDESVVQLLKELDSDQNMEYFDAVDDLLEESYVHTYSTANFTPKGAGANVAVFSSGYGDGVYGSYWGYDESGELCCLLTDFQTIFIQEEEAAAEQEKVQQSDCQKQERAEQEPTEDWGKTMIPVSAMV